MQFKKAKTENMHDFIDIQRVEPSIIVDFSFLVKEGLCTSDARCFLRKAVAAKLMLAQSHFAKLKLCLKVFRGYCPVSAEGSIYSRGCAVDVTLVDENRLEIIMPTAYREGNILSKRSYHLLPKEVLHNRYLLEKVMKACGFRPHAENWWQFEDEDVDRYSDEDFPLENFL